MKTRFMGVALVAVLAALGGTSCGGDDGGGDDDSKGGGAAGKKAPEGSVTCGPEICSPPDDFEGEMCCRNQFEGKCGQKLMGTCIDLPPPPHKDCDSATFTTGDGGKFQVPSCCTSEGQCGLLFAAGFAGSCTSIERAKMFNPMVQGMGGMMFNVMGTLPDEATCSP